MYAPSVAQFRYIWIKCLSKLMLQGQTTMRAHQQRCKAYYDAHVRVPLHKIRNSGRVFSRPDQGITDEPRHKCSPVAAGPMLVRVAENRN